MEEKRPKKEITANDLYLTRHQFGSMKDQPCKTVEEVQQARGQLFQLKQSLGPIDNRQLVEPPQMYIDGLTDGRQKANSGQNEQLMLIDDLRIDKNVKVVSPEVYFFLKEKYGLINITSEADSPIADDLENDP